MQKVENREVVVALESRRAELLKIMRSNFPIDFRLEEAHIRRVHNAKQYLNELKEVDSFLNVGLKVSIVAKNKFKREVAKADFATIEQDGIFCKIATVQSYPCDEEVLVYLVPIVGAV